MMDINQADSEILTFVSVGEVPNVGPISFPECTGPCRAEDKVIDCFDFYNSLS